MKTFNVKLLYLYKFIGQCLPIYAFYQILFIERGKTFTQVAVLIALWSVFAIVFEFPAGVLADRWNRRNMLAVATVLQGVCFIIWFFSYSFLMFALGFVFWGISSAFVSGTEEGLIYDNLKHEGTEEKFTEIYGKAKFYETIGTLVGIASAGVIVRFIDIPVIALISAAICFVNVLLVFQLREKNYYSEQQKDNTPTENEEKATPLSDFFETFKGASKFIKGNTIALVSVLFFVMFASLGSYLDEFDAFIVNDFQLNNTWVSVILTVRFVFVAIGDLLAPYVQKRISSVRQVFLITGFAFVLLLSFALIWSQFALLIFGVAFMVTAIAEILLVNTLQNEIQEEGRATVMSFCSIGQNLVMVCFSLIYALLAGFFTLQQVYLIISIYGIVGGIAFFLLSKIIKNRA